MSNNTVNKSFIQRIDALTVLLYLALVIIGLVAVFTVEYRSTDVSLFDFHKSHTKQIMFFGISLFIGMIILFTDSKFFSSVAFLSYAFGLFLLVITIFIGKNVKGSHSWLGVGAFAFQPGEVCKIFTALALGKFLSIPETNFKTLKDRIIAFALILVPAAIIIKQNETGLALVYFSFILVMYREGLPGAFLIFGFSMVALTLATLLINTTIMFIIITALALAVVLLFRKRFMKDNMMRIIIISSWAFCVLFSQFVVPITFKKVLHGYQIERIFNTLGQDVPPQYVKSEAGTDDKPEKKKDTDYNVKQSKIAIGSGGFWGKGFLNGTSTKNDFVPEQNTDFIFCSIGEQFGFVGSLALILIYLALMVRISIVAERQRSTFSRVYAYCVAAILFFHFAVNISMTIGLAPVIGITLPFLSYGGSSMLSFSILIFILIRLDVDRHVLIR